MADTRAPQRQAWFWLAAGIPFLLATGLYSAVSLGATFVLGEHLVSVAALVAVPIATALGMLTRPGLELCRASPIDRRVITKARPMTDFAEPKASP